MAHDLAFTPTGQAMMMSVRELPWHGLGEVLDHPPTAAEAITAAGLGWTVSKRPIQLPGWLGGHVISDRMAVVRDDIDAMCADPVLGVVGRDWEPLQNRDAFSWFDPIIATGAATYETAGALADGRKVWVLVRLRDPIIAGGDEVHPYLLLANGHDGATSLRLRFTPVRVVCRNTWHVALAGTSKLELRVSHRRGLHMRLDDARRELARFHAGFASIATICDAMAAKPIRTEAHRDYLAQVFPLVERASPVQRRRVEAARAAAFRLAEAGMGNARFASSVWGAFNGVTELLDHGERQDGDEEHRLTSCWFGSDAHAKQRAWERAVAILN
jgi:phage/plasmid-like protein (TIGR03299 family)